MTPSGEVLDCEGVSRDLGVRQGRAWRDAVRAGLGHPGGRLADLLGRLRAAPQPLDRDFWRYFPHLAERTTGLARGAGVGRAELVAALPDAVRDLGGLVADGERTGAGPLVAAWSVPGAPLRLRRSRSDAAIPSLEVTLPWLAGALAGVNQGGLAMAAVAGRGARSHDPCAAPAFLLLQDCLARFSSVEAAADWCRKRPAGGAATLLAADARGRVRGVAVDGERRRDLVPEAGLVVDHGNESARIALAKATAGMLRITPEGVAALATEVGGGPALWIDPVGRRLGLDGRIASLPGDPAPSAPRPA